MNIVKPIARLGTLALAGLALWSCVVVEEDRYPRPLPPERPQMCTQQYDPVCAQRSNRRQTFGNSCMAAAEGFRVVHPGECRPQAGRPPAGQPRACTREYSPVCAARGSRQQYFSNSCMAEAEGFRVLHPGECRAQSGRPPANEPRACTREYAPVCAARGNQRRTFGNSCEAEAANFRIIRRGEC